MVISILMDSPRKDQSRRYYLKNREKIIAKVEEYRNKNRKLLRKRDVEKYANNTEFREKCKAYQKRYRKEHPDRVLEAQRRYRKEHWDSKLRDYHNDWKRRWGKTPKGKMASSLKGYRRRAILKSDIGTHTPQEWNEVIKKHGGKCAYCKQEKKLTKDHIIPLSKGGTNTIDNLQPLCRNCNARKGNRIIHSDPSRHRGGLVR